MPRIEPLCIDQLDDAERNAIDQAERLLGFVANDGLTMARTPRLMHALSALVAAIYAPPEQGGQLDDGLRRLIGLATSSAAACQYCMGHAANSATMHGIDQDKLSAVANFETDPQFSERERAALRVAFHAGQNPNGVTDAMFEQLEPHFDQAQQLEIVAVIALFGFLNRWNATLATELESRPARVLQEILAGKTK